MNSKLPEGFVYLDQIDSTIKYNLRYTTKENFVGRIIKGYDNASRVILSEKAAKSLSIAQELFHKDRWQILIYDAYRPQKPVDDFISWSNDKSDQKMKKYYYPYINKEDSFNLGYIEKKSAHTRGSTVDLTLLPIDQNIKNIKESYRILDDGSEIIFLDDNTIDMRSSFDLFSKASHYENNLIADYHKQNRHYMRNIMKSFGWKAYKKEWRHFTFAEEPFKNEYFNFDM
jgi:D-alanyl-D-alanine dipeptidase